VASAAYLFALINLARDYEAGKLAKMRLDRAGKLDNFAH
jgi:hypothetical protein